MGMVGPRRHRDVIARADVHALGPEPQRAFALDDEDCLFGGAVKVRWKGRAPRRHFVKGSAEAYAARRLGQAFAGEAESFALLHRATGRFRDVDDAGMALRGHGVLLVDRETTP